MRLLLQEGYAVRALVLPGSPTDNLQGLDIAMVPGDINDPGLERAIAGCRYVFHLAAYNALWEADWELAYRCNVLGTRNVLAAARLAGVERTVYTGSAVTIGVAAGGAIADETWQATAEDQIGPYARSKFYGEREVNVAVENGQDVVLVHPTTPMGPWDLRPTPAGDMILRFMRRQIPVYTHTGLNLIDVRDVAWGHLLALQKGKCGDRYLLGCENITLKDLLDRLAELTGLPAPQRSIPTWLPIAVAWVEERLLAPLGRKPSVPLAGVRMAAKPLYFDSSKAVRELGLPQSPLEPALQEAIAWFAERGYAELPTSMPFDAKRTP